MFSHLMRHVFFDLLWFHQVFVGRPPASWAALWKDSTWNSGTSCSPSYPQGTRVSTCIPLWWGRSHVEMGLHHDLKKNRPHSKPCWTTKLLDQDAQVYHHLGLTPQFSDTCKSSWMCICVIRIYIYMICYIRQKIRVLTLKSGILCKTVFSWDMQA